MKVLNFALNLFLYALWFAFGGLVYGLGIGIVVGMAFSFLLSLLMLISGNGVGGAIRTVFELIFFSLMVGAESGGFAGGVMGVISLVIVGASVSHRSYPKKKFFKAVGGAHRGAWVCALAGSVSGALFFALRQILFGAGTTQKILDAAFAPFDGGFFYGSIAGFCIGFFAGALIGGLSREPNWLTMRLANARADIKAKMSAMWQDKFAN